ncbi:hypothetical protein [Chryseolinea lacunae]|uniref:DUF4157 domain-containing protein n=1 Tax=Chryseolinea lacunae TaxID=2801331 RepID=A0ABS1KXR6_9BACT|nr:hypothetical protein [Chryseolinea lacunae]MBL0744125.1 hypothetical protein [Chryseolinea lacunae]
MFRIVAPFITGKHDGMSFFVFIFVRNRATLKDHELINHETIHFYQQMELLFVFHWLLYVGFYVWKRLQGKPHHEAYRSIPFEEEAYAEDKNLKYIFERRPYAWVKYV